MGTRAFQYLFWVGLCGVALACGEASTSKPMEGEAGSGGSSQPPPTVEVLASNVPYDTDPMLGADDAATLGSGNRAFAFDLYAELASSADNVFASPFSISVALAMTYPGAEGATESAIASALHFDLPEPTLHSAFNATLLDLRQRPEQLDPAGTGNGFELGIVNQAWGQQGYPFLDGYLDVLAQHYGTGLFGVNFAESEATRQTINDWVYEQTEDRVDDLLPPGSLTGDTRLVLTNAIYFKGNWLFPFDPDSTREGVFHGSAGDRTVSMMQHELQAAYTEREAYVALELAYVSPSVRMLLILPAEGQFEAVSAGLNDAFFQEVRAGLSAAKVHVTLPKFSFEFESALKGPLSALGMTLPFSEDADFSAIAGGVEPLWIDEVYHKTFVAVDEVGTEAAAATAVVITTESGSVPLTFDRPFLFAIHDEPTGQILFLGRLMDPG